MTEESRRLSRATKLGYGSVELGIEAIEILLQVYLLKFYNTVAGLPPFYTGLALAIAIVWDAISDPIMGTISDRTETRHGRRRPYFLPGAIALSLAFIAIYNPPALTGRSALFFYLLSSYLILNTATTVIGVPHASLGAELSFDRHERTSIYASRRVFGALGLVVGTVLPAVILGTLGGESEPGAVARSRSLASVVIAPVLIATAAWSFRATRGRDDEAATHPATGRSVWRHLVDTFRQQRSAFRNPVFLPLLVAFVIAGVGRAVNASIALYYYDYRLGLGEERTVFAVLLPFFATFLVCIPFWVRVSRRKGKKTPAILGVLGLGAMTTILYPALPPGSVLGPMITAVLGGFFGSSIVLLDSLVADTVDYDKLRTGLNREGLYFGVWKMSTKLARALGLLMSGYLLSGIGFDRTAITQSPEVAWRLALIFGPVVGLTFVAGGLVLWAMPLTEERHRRIQRLLLRRRSGSRDVRSGAAGA